MFVAAFDSQLKWCASLMPEFRKAGFDCAVLVPDVRNALSKEQIAAVGVEAVEYTTWERMIERCLASDVAVSALAGPFTRQIIYQLHRAAPEGGPVTVGCWVGIVIEKQIAGYLDRCGADIVSVNSREDYDRFCAVAARLGLPTGNLMLNGLPFLPAHAATPKQGPVKTVLFADQPTIPADRAERRYLYDRLIAYARRHPDRKVILKPRHKKGEDTIHRMKHHPEDVLRGMAFPENFEIGYTPIAQALADTDLLITVSSTACLESVAAGVRTALVLDMGVHERYGNQVFVDSGLLRTFDQLEADEIGAPDPDWVAAYFLGYAQAPNARIVERASQLVASGAHPGAAVRRTAYFASALVFAETILRLRPPENYADLLAQGTGPTVRALLRAGNRFTPSFLRPTARKIAQILRFV
ncbi:DUF6716 putative glycosyltransferase [Pelagibacterium xiamenense]|uniref:DUF6716 putative glycosyltransferase n=1 Tax=Pelagibacterium xiamenense TaxID=2901140 RepID=UPI001E60060F|nr:DUF6716 putative glycosyltransferase [Pelagibacterium xiamenense]MCD7061409.1 hypothetical protein [Pelagibacterium xiamenense]